jgi:nucleoside-diphosphate-sugar epimerase
LKVLITGANGFLGRRVVAEFLQRGHSVRALVRPAAKVERLGWPETVEVFLADLRASRDLVSAFEGIDAVVHLAAGVTGGEDAQFAASVVGTERLLEAMAKSWTKRLVLASSFSVYDWSALKVGSLLDEDSPIEPPGDLYDRDGYAVAKVWQERVARRMAEENGWALTVLRPGFLWGRGNEEIAGLGQKLGRFQLVFGPSTRLPLSHVDNCAHAFAEATENPRAIGQTFNIVDDEGPTIWQYLGDFLRGTGERRLRVPIPYGLAIAGVRLARWTSKKVFRGKGKLPSILVPCRFEARFKPLQFTNRKAREVLGWVPPFDRAEQNRRTYGPPLDEPATRPDLPSNAPEVVGAATPRDSSA